MEVPGRDGRIIKLLCLNEEEPRFIRDLGYTRDGTPTGQRQMLERMLETMSRTPAGAKIAVFALAEPPTKAWHVDDPIDRKLRDFNGRWQTPGPEWLAERQRRIDENKARLAAADARVRDMAQISLADQLGKLVTTTANTVAKQKGAQ